VHYRDIFEMARGYLLSFKEIDEGILQGYAGRGRARRLCCRPYLDEEVYEGGEG